MCLELVRYVSVKRSSGSCREDTFRFSFNNMRKVKVCSSDFSLILMSDFSLGISHWVLLIEYE